LVSRENNPGCAGLAVSTDGRLIKGRQFLISFFFVLFIWIFFLLRWFLSSPAEPVVMRVPGLDGAPAKVSSGDNATATVQIGASFTLFDGVPGSSNAVWPQFRGPERDNQLTLPYTILNRLPETISPLWTLPLGEGHAGPAVYNGTVYVLDYDEEQDADALRAFSFETGKEIWRRWYRVKVKRNHGMSRTVPAVSDSVVVTIGPRCHVMAANALTGDFLWGMDMVQEYGTEIPLWYTGQCPFIDDTVAVLAPAGRSLVIGVHYKTGEVLWETANPKGWKMSHSSIMPMRFGGRKMYLYCAVGGLVGIAADGEDRGSVLFETGDFNHSVVAPSPVVLDKGRIFMTAGYGAGSILFQVSEENGTFSIAALDTISVKEGASSEQQTPLYHRGHLFMVLPKDAGEYRGQFVCYDPDDLRTIVWASGARRRFGLGPYLMVNNTFYILNDNGVLYTASFSTQRYQELSSLSVMDAIDAWAPMALVDSTLLLRDAGKMVALNLKK